MEVWRAIPGYEGIYEASDNGRIQRISYQTNRPTPHILSANDDGHGYPTVQLCVCSETKRRKVHRLVMAAFHGEDPREVNHKDGNRGNPRLENLEYATHSENELHKSRVLRNWGGPSGDKNFRAIKPDVKRVMALKKSGLSNRAIARKLGLKCHKMVAVILEKRHWTQR